MIIRTHVPAAPSLGAPDTTPSQAEIAERGRRELTLLTSIEERLRQRSFAIAQKIVKGGVNADGARAIDDYHAARQQLIDLCRIWIAEQQTLDSKLLVPDLLMEFAYNPPPSSTPTSPPVRNPSFQPTWDAQNVAAAGTAGFGQMFLTRVRGNQVIPASEVTVTYGLQNDRKTESMGNVFGLGIIPASTVTVTYGRQGDRQTAPISSPAGIKSGLGNPVALGPWAKGIIAVVLTVGITYAATQLITWWLYGSDNATELAKLKHLEEVSALSERMWLSCDRFENAADRLECQRTAERMTRAAYDAAKSRRDGDAGLDWWQVAGMVVLTIGATATFMVWQQRRR